MKRSQRGCVGCEAKQAGATTWQVGYVVGSHQMAVLSADESGGDDVPEDGVCALHSRMGREATALGLRIIAKRRPQPTAADCKRDRELAKGMVEDMYGGADD